MAKYVDGFVIPIPKKNVKAYQKMAKVACRVWLDHGALEYRECIGDDLKQNFGLPFPRMAKLKSGETAVFAWITYKSKSHRASVNKKVMKDQRIQGYNNKKMPFDMKRMAYGGFKVLVDDGRK